MRSSFLLLLLAATPSTAFFRPSETEAPAEQQEDADGDSDYDIPHLFFQPNNDLDGEATTSQPISGAPSGTPSIYVDPSSGPSESSSMSSDVPSAAPTSLIVGSASPSEDPTHNTSTAAPSMVTSTAPSDASSSAPSEASSSAPSEASSSAPSEASSSAPSVTSSTTPTVSPSAAPSAAPTMNDTTISDVALPATLNATRSSNHRYQWGATYEGCDPGQPPVYLSCGGGGLLSSIAGNDAVCEQLSLDRAQCNSTHVLGDEDGAYVDFTCTGVTSTHLTATAEVFPSTASNCNATYDVTIDDDGDVVTSRGGNAAIFGVLGRVCAMENGRDTVENIYDCNKGVSGQQGDNSFCATGAMCTVDEICSNGTCTAGDSCSVSLGSISMSNKDDREACSTVEESMDLIGANFTATSLGAFYDVEWTYSGSALGCQAAIPDVTFECKNGGQVKLGDDYSFCLEQGSTITCTNPDGASTEMRESMFLQIWCHGDSYDQLELQADLPEIKDNSAMCAKEGMVVQGLRIRKGCWNDKLVSAPSFCTDSNQVFADSNLCYAGYFCSATYCEGQQIEVPAVSVVVSDPATESCVRAA